MPDRFPSNTIPRSVQYFWCRCSCLLLMLSLAAAAHGVSPEPAVNDNGLAIPSAENILATLQPAHPRVMARPETFDDLKALIRKGGLPAQIYVEIKKSADQHLSAPVSKYEKPDGRRLLSVSRRVLDRVRTLAMVYRLEDDPRYADRAWRELEAAAAFQDWNPSHFLDTAEMTHAFALGYDWLYDCWSEDQRRVLREAVVSKGLREGLRVYESRKGWPRRSWALARPG